jgi:hypothetical protein
VDALRTIVVACAATLAVIVGLLNGACGGSGGGGSYVDPYAPPPPPPSGYCWYPGVCREVTQHGDCRPSESFEEGTCPDTLRTGACVDTHGQRVYLYAPIHGWGTPSCDRYPLTGETHFRPD